MKKNKIYIAGCAGMLGEAFIKKFYEDYNLKCTDINTNEEWISYLDFRNHDNYKDDVIKFKPDWLFHLGAHTDLEYCEQNQEDTYSTNTDSVKNAVQISNDIGIPILYISTAGIFDGKKDVYDETDQPVPLGHYAKSKYLGEKFVIENSKNYLICRAGWMMGGGPAKDKKFIQKIMKQIKDGNKNLYIVNDKLGTPTYTHDFAENVKLLIQESQRGLFNMVCQGLTSRLEVAREILSFFNLSDKIKIIEVTSDYFSKEYFADRPDCERLINKNLDILGFNKMRNWKIAIKEYLNNYYNNYI